MGWLLLGTIGFTGWLVLSTYSTIPWYFRRMIEIGGYFVVKQLGLLILVVWLFRQISYAPARLVVGIVSVLAWWWVARDWLHQMDELILNVRAKLHATSQTSDCLTHFELDFYLRNRSLLVERQASPYTRELREMERHLNVCLGCRVRLRRDEQLWRERTDPEES